MKSRVSSSKRSLALSLSSLSQREIASAALHLALSMHVRLALRLELYAVVCGLTLLCCAC